MHRLSHSTVDHEVYAARSLRSITHTDSCPELQGRKAWLYLCGRDPFAPPCVLAQFFWYSVLQKPLDWRRGGKNANHKQSPRKQHKYPNYLKAATKGALIWVLRTKKLCQNTSWCKRVPAIKIQPRSASSHPALKKHALNKTRSFPSQTQPLFPRFAPPSSRPPV